MHSTEERNYGGDRLVTVVFGDQLKQIINQLHEVSPFSNNLNECSLKYSPTSNKQIYIESSENITETIDFEGMKNRFS